MKCFASVILIIMMSVMSCYGTVTGNSALLSHLDSLISHSDEIEMEKQLAIAELGAKMRSARSDDERYRINNMLYDQYYFYNVDSAMNFIDRNLHIAAKSGNTDSITELKIKKSFLLAASGLLKESGDVLSGYSGEMLPLPLRKKYYGQMIYLYSHMGNYMGGPADGQNYYYAVEQEYKDSLVSILTPEDADYLWYQGLNKWGNHSVKNDSIVTQLEKALAASKLDSREDAQKAYILGCLYLDNGDRENYLKYMIMSAIADVNICNRDIASVQELAKECYANGDIDRAYNYIEYCLEAALKYPNRVRAITIAPLQRQINKAYQERNHRQERRLRIFLFVVCGLVLVLGFTIFTIFRQMKRLKSQGAKLDKINHTLNTHVMELSRAKSQLTEVNEKLSALNTQLTEANDGLREANYVKEEYVGYVFSICSSYIRKLDDFRKTINRKAKAKQWDDIRSITDSTSMAKDELREFYNNFDTIFLHIYPHFVSDFNALLMPEERITPKEGELLNTELRIYALVRLGITDSVKIAEFLHCSAQTVYNNRFKVRNKAVIPKTEFAEAVKTLGKVAIE